MGGKVQKSLLLKETLKILKNCNEDVGLKQCELAKLLGMPSSTLTSLRKMKKMEDTALMIGGKCSRRHCCTSVQSTIGLPKFSFKLTMTNRQY